MALLAAWQRPFGGGHHQRLPSPFQRILRQYQLLPRLCQCKVQRSCRCNLHPGLAVARNFARHWNSQPLLWMDHRALTVATKVLRQRGGDRCRTCQGYRHQLPGSSLWTVPTVHHCCLPAASCNPGETLLHRNVVRHRRGGLRPHGHRRCPDHRRRAHRHPGQHRCLRGHLGVKHGGVTVPRCLMARDHEHNCQHHTQLVAPRVVASQTALRSAARS